MVFALVCVSAICIEMDGSASVLQQSQVSGTTMENVLCKLPMEVARKALCSYLDRADVVRLDSAALVHTYRESLQNMYKGKIVANTAILEVDQLTAQSSCLRAAHETVPTHGCNMAN